LVGVFFSNSFTLFQKGRETSSDYFKVCLLLFKLLLQKLLEHLNELFKKSGETCSHFLKLQLKFKSHMSEPLKNFLKINNKLKGE